MDEDDIELDLESGEMSLGNQPTEHPTASFFHVAFKSAALIVYLFASTFYDDFVLIFVVCILLLACDFWTVKNITGRLLVGLRWWNEVKEDGTNVWIYESAPAGRINNSKEDTLFWGTLYLTPLVWGLFGIVAIAGLNFQWLLVVIVALTLSGANLVGYWKCQKDAKAKLQSGITGFLARRL